MKEETLKRERQFTKELGEFLSKWDAVIELEYIGNGYWEDRVMVCYLNSVWKEDKQITNYSRIEFGCYIPKTIEL
jgi:hypothetical protein